MATMNEVVEYVDRMKINTYTDEDKYGWIKAVESMIFRDVLGVEPPDTVVPDDADAELIAQTPYDDIYRLYVMAMIDFHNREFDNYNNMALMFGERLEQFKAWYIRENRPASNRNFRNVMG